MSNSVDPDHLDLCCFQKLLLSPVAVKELSLSVIIRKRRVDANIMLQRKFSKFNHI